MRALAYFVLVACGTDDPPERPRTCTGALYDPCDTEHDCMSERCQGYDGLFVCSQPCTPGEPCPDADGEPATCAPDGTCLPPRANDCAR